MRSWLTGARIFSMAPLLALHIDFNTVRLESTEVLQTLEAAASVGYNAVLWDVEDKVRWETCPECVHREAFTKDEFRTILKRAKDLGLRPIPVLQTVGHAEYVLESERHCRWRELAAQKGCYCASNRDVRAFLRKWVHEYLDLFGDDVRDFHLGGAGVDFFGACRECSKRNRMELFAEHLLAVSEELRERNIRPGIWGDIILSCDDSDADVIRPRDFTVWCQLYDNRGSAGNMSANWSPKIKRLKGLGFDVVVAAASSCYGDGPFLPNYAFHFATVDTVADLARREELRGICVTSWSVWQGLKSLQRPIWEYAGTGDRTRAIQRAFGRIDEQTLMDLASWDAELTCYDGRAWQGQIKDARPAPHRELDRIIERLEKDNPSFRAEHLKRVESLERKIARALGGIRANEPQPNEMVNRLVLGAEQSLAFLGKIRAVLNGRQQDSVPLEETASYFASEQTALSASNSAAVVWSVLENGVEPYRYILFCDPQPKNLPELLTCSDGTRVRSSFEWESKRRPELLRFFTDAVYGRWPVEHPENMTFERISPDVEMMSGRAVRMLIRIRYVGPWGEGQFRVVAFVPKRVTPAPAFVLICNRAFEENVDPERKVKTGFWPAEQIVDQGYAAISFYNGDLSNDNDREEFEDGVHAVFGPRQRTDDSWGSFSAWAWGASRVMDWIEAEPRIDAKKVAIVGHSRGGKTALWVGATDVRFALTCVNDSGCGGARLNRADIALTENLELINSVNPHWFCRGYRKFNRHDRELPFDQHELMALAAPRLLAVGSASMDWGAGPYGEFLSALFASPAWSLYGRVGLGSDSFPPVGQANQTGCISYHLREGGHDLNIEDWKRYMDFAACKGWK